MLTDTNKETGTLKLPESSIRDINDHVYENGGHSSILLSTSADRPEFHPEVSLAGVDIEQIKQDLYQ